MSSRYLTVMSSHGPSCELIKCKWLEGKSHIRRIWSENSKVVLKAHVQLNVLLSSIGGTEFDSEPDLMDYKAKDCLEAMQAIPRVRPECVPQCCHWKTQSHTDQTFLSFSSVLVLTAKNVLKMLRLVYNCTSKQKYDGNVETVSHEAQGCADAV
ncbi:uncharacterized protein V6R79_021081 [Siganus canaliculatus]